jgi:hypothetical protein
MQWLIDHIVCYFQTALHLAVNAVVAGLGAFWGLIVGLLPDMPGYPDVPSAVTTAVGYAYYGFDVGWLIAYLASFGALMAAVFLVMIPLRWIKAAD